MPAAWKARIALRTVCVAQPRMSAIRAGGRPPALAKRICARRRVKASGERRPAWIACRSESSRGRTKVGGFIQSMMRRTRPLHKITLENALGIAQHVVVAAGPGARDLEESPALRGRA